MMEKNTESNPDPSSAEDTELSSISYKHFCKIVSTISPLPEALKSDLRALFGHYRLPSSNSLNIEDVKTELKKRILAAYPKPASKARTTFRKIQRQIILEYCLNDKLLDPEFPMTCFLLDLARDKNNELVGDTKNWQEAIQAARDFITINPTWPGRETDPKTLSTQFSREYVIGQAARRIRDRGFRLGAESGNIVFEEEEEERLAKHIDGLVKKIGGLNVAKAVFKILSPSFNEEQQRYHLGRRVSPVSSKSNPSVPNGYLLNLAAKHALQRGRPYEDGKMQELCALVRDYIAVFDVEPHNAFELGIGCIRLENLSRYIQELALYDSLFCFRQLRFTDIIKYLETTPFGNDSNRRFADSWTLSECVKVAKAIIELAQGTRGPLEIDSRALCDNLGDLKPEVVSGILDSISHSVAPNQSFLLPGPKSSVPDAWKKPLIKLSGDKYLLLDLSWSSIAFVAAVWEVIRSEMPTLDQELGSVAENLLKNEFTSHGVPTKGGKYKVRRNRKGHSLYRNEEESTNEISPVGK
ncbi:MAG: hypothetical protein P1U82_22105 [Verrucomicrobiales bacterium]|nr:hypothetical protein [Verrucomicrobiales bacterium]